MILYPKFNQNGCIGITAPSSGVEEINHEMFKSACERMKERGFDVLCGETVWTQKHAKSASAIQRAAEFMNMMNNDNIGIIIPPWGGELLIEILEYLDFSKMTPKWVMGYSDTSLLLLAITLNTGIATAHGVNLVDLRGEYSDQTTAQWLSALSTQSGESNTQYSSEKYQKQWDFKNPTPEVFHLTEPTSWKTVSEQNEKIAGRLLGGCIDVIRHLIGTPFGNVKAFREKHMPGEAVIWYFENCELSTTDVRRTLVHMKYAGWFENCSGIVFGRSAANHSIQDYTIDILYKDLADELQVPIIYDVDCGHVPPQMTFINGAHATFDIIDGTGTVIQRYI